MRSLQLLRRVAIICIVLIAAWIILGSILMGDSQHNVISNKDQSIGRARNQQNVISNKDQSIGRAHNQQNVISNKVKNMRKRHNKHNDQYNRRCHYQPNVTSEKDRNSGRGHPVVYQPLIKSSPISKDLLIHRAFYDDRKRDGFQNVTVFFVVASFAILENDWIVGCGVGDTKAAHYRINIYGGWWGRLLEAPKIFYKYEQLNVHCFDLPVKKGDRAFLIYKVGEFCPHYIVESQYPVIIPAAKVNSNDQSVSVVSCVKANTKKAKLLNENMQYQKHLGVDHISLLAISSFVRDGGLLKFVKNPDTHSLILKGFVSIDVWKQWYDTEENRHWSESLRKVGCVYNYLGTYDYAIPMDSDDFFNPRVTGEENIKYYLERFCYKNSIGSCILKWIKYYPQHCGLNDVPSDGNVTAALKSYTHSISPLGKAIHKTVAIVDATYHDALPHGKRNLMPGYISVKVNPFFAYMAHNRYYDKPRNKNC